MTKARVLVVDDDEVILDSLRRGLELEGYSVVTAPDGTHALRVVAADRLDAVVLDVGLPDLNGRIVAARMRAGGLATPILILSALDQVDDRIAGLEAGADDYLVKPFAMDELTARLRALLRRAAYHSEQATGVDPPLRLGPLAHRLACRGGQLGWSRPVPDPARAHPARDARPQPGRHPQPRPAA